MKCIALLLTVLPLAAQIRPVPPAGIEVPAAAKESLQADLKLLAGKIDRLRGVELLPDVRIFHEAVRYALDYGEFLKPEEIGYARELLRAGHERADQLARGQAPWTTATGLIVRGYVSKIDGSVQPYGLVVPDRYSPRLAKRWRVDAWFHGRAENLTEINFLRDRMTNPGQFTPRDTIVLHLYGRYCNANKFAGEVDLFEALDDVRKHYPVDENRIVMRGFSMGGAAAWHIAAHHAGLWAAVAPGAGFSETPEFLNIFKNEKPPQWEQTLWRLYNATDYAANFYNLPVVAYSGEIDRQKQAADAMDRVLTAEGLRMTHIIGPNTPHRYHPDSKLEIDRRIDAIAERGRDPYPRRIRFTTFTLRYNRLKWVIADELQRHWERARIDAQTTASGVAVKTENVNALTLDFGPGGAPFEPDAKVTVTIDGHKVQAPGPMSDGSWRAQLRKAASGWALSRETPPGLRKVHGLQGPVDDAFMDRFLIVRPTGTAQSSAVAKWVDGEMPRAIREWRRQFRGEAPVKSDTDVTEDDIANSNLILWGDPGSNSVVRRVVDKLPVKWQGDSVAIGSTAGSTHIPILIYPNPLNPRKYVVLNSGFTYREFDYLNNARQVPKIPDWALVDISTAPDGRYPGRITAAGFFDEVWQPARSSTARP